MATEEHRHDSSAAVNSGTAAPSPQDRAIPDDLFCPQCGYNLRGLTSDRCPECGYSIDAVRSVTSEIPWVHRRDIGWFRAYWKTVSLVMFRQRRFCDEIARDVSYADSQSFRWITVFHAYLPVLLGTIALYAFAPARLFGDRTLDGPWADVWPVAILHLCFLIFLAAATGVPSYFFHPRGVPVYLQNRAIALSYYASGSLAVIVLPVLAGVTPAIVDLPERLAIICVLIAVLIPVGQVAAWWLDLIRITRRVVSQQPGRANVVALCVPILWLTIAGLIFFALPFAVFCILVVIHSLG